MKSAKDVLNGSERMKITKTVLTETVGAERAEQLWHQAETGLDGIYQKYADLPPKVHRHSDGVIFPSAAIYLVLRESIPDKAMYVMEEGSKRVSSQAGRNLNNLLKVPGMKGLFVKIFGMMTKSNFGSDAGFEHTIYRTDSKVFRMDVTLCPYCRLCGELDCPELTHIFCDSDVYAYGSLDGIRFTRTQTLGKGGEKCDFLVESVN